MEKIPMSDTIDFRQEVIFALSDKSISKSCLQRAVRREIEFIITIFREKIRQAQKVIVIKRYTDI
jgi:hypothetical protein